MFSQRSRKRKGSVPVEFAFTAPILFLIVFGVTEFGRMTMAYSAMEEAARAACRKAIIQGATVADVETKAAELLTPIGIDKYTISVDPNPPSSADRWTPVTVTISANYSDMNWLPIPQFVGTKRLTASCALASEHID